MSAIIMPFYRDRADDWEYFDKHNIGTELKFIFFPKQCYISGKYLWLEYAYRKTAMYTGPGEPIFEHRWYSKLEYIIEQLKR